MSGTSSVNLADVSQFLVGSDMLKLTPFFIKNFTIPGIAMSHPELPTRSGVSLRMGADSIDFGELSFEVMLDSGFQTYFELMDLMFTEVDFERDTFSTPCFDLWVQVLNANKEVLFRVDFKNCRIASVGDLNLDPSAELGSSVSVGIVYDFYTYTREICPEGNCRRGPNRWVENSLNVFKSK